jgi:hypothetical protein
MRRWLAVVFVLLVPLLVTQAASPAVKDFGANVNVSPSGPGQFTAMIQNTDINAVLDSFVFVPGPNLKVTGVLRSDAGNCIMSGATFTCSGLNLAQAVCFCTPGGIVNVTFTGTGDGGLSTIAQIGTPGAVAAAAAPTGPVTTTTPSTVQSVKVANTAATPKTDSAKKVVAKAKIAFCKKGQHSTKKRPCRARK